MRKRFTHTNTHYKPRTFNRTVIRWCLDMDSDLSARVDERIMQLRISRTEFIRRIVERELVNVVSNTVDPKQELTREQLLQNDDPADFLR